MLKIYLSYAYIDINAITNYLEMSPEQILSIGMKILQNTSSESNSKKIIDNLKLTDVNMEEYTDNTFVTKVWLSLHQILWFTTFDLWNQHKDRAKKTAAGLKLNSKMKALKTVNATESTALAIAKAAENANASYLATLETHLRISNQES